MNPALMVSPHLDDAVWSGAHWLAAHPGSMVVTVFAGLPADPAMRTEWDGRCGFGRADEALATRRREDAQALARLGAAPLWLDFVDSQYGQTPAVDAVAAALQALLQRLAPSRLLYPLGLFHSDHALVHAACLQALRQRGSDAPPALAYEDALYRGMAGQLQQRLVALHAAGITATPHRLQGTEAATDPARKQQALQCYASQLRAFGEGGVADTGQPERFWRLQWPADAPP